MNAVKRLVLPKDKFTLVSSQDFSRVVRFKWKLDNFGYVIRRIPKIGNNKTVIFLHRFILNTPNGYFTDHIDGNKLNNCRENLRICNHSQNHYNRKINCNSSTGVRGVWLKPNGKYKVVINCDNKRYFGGTFFNKLNAIKRYNELAQKLYGQFARLNSERISNAKN